ncbi:amidoligase enzyme-domain-containing protein [Penicillium sp. CMV-2018d]|nr:amidoligase enzyme-domain-containing protein [Penicillium sp. CMV-2018d]
MDAGFRIGIELEILLTHRKKAKDEFPDLEAFANHLIAHFHSARRPYPRVHNDVDGIYEGSEISAEWSLTDDVTIKPDTDDQWSLELVSPILQYHERSPWRDEVRHMFRALSLVCDVEANQSCGVHVHISPPKNSAWSLDTLKSICRSIFYFERAILAIVPDHRRSNAYTASNRCDNSRLKGKSVRECLSILDRCENHVEIVDLMNDNGRRYFAWNFTNLYYGGKATLEFRQAPGASDETACLPWVEFVASFVNSSKMMSSDRNISRFSRDVQGLRRILTSFGVSGSNRGILESLFRGKSGYINPSPVRALVTAEQETLKAKEDEGNAKNLVMKKLQSM